MTKGLDVSRFFDTRPARAQDPVSDSDSGSDGGPMLDYDPEAADFGGALDGTAASTRRVVLNAAGHDDSRAHYRDVPRGKRRALPIDDDEFMGGRYRGVKTSRADLGYQTAKDSDADGDAEERRNSDQDGEEEEEKELLSFSEISENEDGGRLREQLRALTQEDDNTMELVARRATADGERGAHVKAQLHKWQNALDVRVRLQPLLTLAQRIPPTAEYSALVEGCSAEHGAASGEAERLALSLVAFCTGTERADLQQRPALSLERALAKHDAKMTAVWKESLDRWHQKVALTETTGRRQLKVINQSLWSQVELSLRDRDRLFKRALTPRTDVKPIVGSAASVLAFDDTDFFGTLVRSWVDTGADAALSAGLVVKAVVRQQRDKKATKGRMLRYDVQDKLVSFMVPAQSPMDWSEERVDAFFASIFPASAADAEN